MCSLLQRRQSSVKLVRPKGPRRPLSHSRSLGTGINPETGANLCRHRLFAERPNFEETATARAASPIVQKRPAVQRLTTRRVRSEKSARGQATLGPLFTRTVLWRQRRRRRAMRARAPCSLAQNERGASPLRMQRARRTTQLHRNPDRSSLPALPPNDPFRPSADLPSARDGCTARPTSAAEKRNASNARIARLRNRRRLSERAA